MGVITNIFIFFNKNKMFERYYRNIKVCESILDMYTKLYLKNLNLKYKFPDIEIEEINWFDYQGVMEHLRNAELHLIDKEVLKQINSTKEETPEGELLKAGFDSTTCFFAMKSNIYANNLKVWKEADKKRFMQRLEEDKEFKKNCLKYYS